MLGTTAESGKPRASGDEEGVSAHEFHAWNWNFQIFSTKRGMDGVNG